MRIVLNGVETNNKGAELMLYAILQEIEKRFPDAIVYVGMNSVKQGLGYIQTSVRLREKTVSKIRKVISLSLIKRLSRIFHFNPILFEDIYAVSGTDYFFDGSGLWYSDQWNFNSWEIEKRRRLLFSNYKTGAKIVLLPQAFGPLSSENIKKSIIDLNDYANLIIAREKTSYSYIKDSGLVSMDKVGLYPDFTSLITGKVPERYKYLQGRVCIIPNNRMIASNTTSKELYLGFIRKIIEAVRLSGRDVFLLNHEGVNDERLCYLIQQDNCNVEVITGLNALEVKGIISISYLVVTSRFHGAASALNSCVPCLSTSWNHKYEELFREYKMQDAVLNINDIDGCVMKVSEYIDSRNNDEIRFRLKEILPAVQDFSRSMWDKIWNLK